MKMRLTNSFDVNKLFDGLKFVWRIINSFDDSFIDSFDEFHSFDDFVDSFNDSFVWSANSFDDREFVWRILDSFDDFI